MIFYKINRNTQNMQYPHLVIFKKNLTQQYSIKKAHSFEWAYN